MSAVAYRPDIDGLRAVAVVAVVLFHAGVPGVGGGYVGVDVFFVISGFLITAIVHREIGAGGFFVARFYERRIRRILPALLVMIGVTAVACGALMVPDDMASFGLSAVSSALSVSNVLFWLQSGYFDPGAHTKPLLHTWSLSVEEQFYLVLPVGLMALARWRAPVRIFVWIGLAASLGMSAWQVRHDPTAAFYLLPSRAFELLLGSAMAVGAVPRTGSRIGREAAALAGLALVLAAIIGFDASTRFPGEAALVPCLGACLVIWSGTGGDRTLVARALGARPVVFIGLISYSLYLWHWPLIVLASYHAEGPLDRWQTAGVLALSVATAILSWRFVETPFRRSRPAGGRSVLATGAAAIALATLIGGAMAVAGGNARFVEAVYGARIAAIEDIARRSEPRGDCVNLMRESARTQGCILGDAGVVPSVALFGDSFAGSLAAPIDSAFRGSGLAVVPYVYYSCPSILGTSRSEALAWAPAFVADCRSYVEAAMREIIADKAIGFVVMSNNYDWYLNRTSTVTQGPLLVADDGGTIAERIRETVRVLVAAGKTVLFVGTSPSGHEAFGARAVMKKLVTGRLSEDARVPAKDCPDTTRQILYTDPRDFLRNLYYVDVNRYFVKTVDGGPSCFLTADRLPLTSDGSHVSALISGEIARSILADIVAPPPR